MLPQRVIGDFAFPVLRHPGQELSPVIEPFRRIDMESRDLRLGQGIQIDAESLHAALAKA